MEKLLGGENEVAGKEKVNVQLGRGKALETKVYSGPCWDNVILERPAWGQWTPIHLASHIGPCAHSALFQVLRHRAITRRPGKVMGGVL